MRRILIAYSSPADEQPLRLDREQRRVNQALEIEKSDVQVDFKQAATLEDLARAIAQTKYDILQFSGHGDSDGFCLDMPSGHEGHYVESKRLSALVEATQSTLSAVVLMSCYSAGAAENFLKVSPYVITVSGEADDQAAIDFSGHFYEHYFRTGSVEIAFNFASAFVHNALDVSLTKGDAHERTLPRLAVYPHPHRDPLYVDLTEARHTIANLDISEERFTSIMTRKLKVHKWIFDGEREDVILPIAGYFARFSWRNARDVVYCHWVYKPDAGLSVEVCSYIADLIVCYNDIYVSSYRRSDKPVTQQDPRAFRHALTSLHDLKNYFLLDNSKFAIFEAVNQIGARMLLATCVSNLAKADQKMELGELSSAVIYAETALSAIHDAITSLVESISTGK
ncbi:CHAT domain-containing protein [Pseudomonas monteilii]|uniref:CHAT domain-containing protein n=1 Tax=Pseudomonas monteilii TaxID=76759 RepID=UPI001FD1612B|nr:CHAT domain-containing protein [Pseudomonas monteilii]MCJ7853074.1 CHAT domain-containing protein [Pseudomonas monteilii]